MLSGNRLCLQHFLLQGADEMLELLDRLRRDALRFGVSCGSLLDELVDAGTDGKQVGALRRQILLGLDSLLLNFQMRILGNEIVARQLRDRRCTCADQRQRSLAFFDKHCGGLSFCSSPLECLVDRSQLRAVLCYELIEEGMLKSCRYVLGGGFSCREPVCECALPRQGCPIVTQLL